jgi:hypothetical protein
VSLSAKLKTADISSLAPVAFYGAVGVVLLILLPLTNFPPHVGLTGIMSLITAYGLFKKRFWAIWLVAVLFAVATTLSLYTLFYVGFSDLLTAIGLVTYAVLTWLTTLYIVIKRRAPES